MEIQVINDNAVIRVVTDGVPLLIIKSQIKTIDTVKNEMVRIDIGEGALHHIYIRHADVTLPQGLVDAAALRDVIKAMLDGSGNDFTPVVQGLAQVHEDITAASANQAGLLTNMLAVLNSVKQSLDGTNSNFAQPARVDESVPMVVYNGYVVALATAPQTANPVWAIQRITRNGDMFVYEWANGNRNYTNVWDDRYTLNYQPLAVPAA